MVPLLWRLDPRSGKKALAAEGGPTAVPDIPNTDLDATIRHVIDVIAGRLVARFL